MRTMSHLKYRAAMLDFVQAEGCDLVAGWCQSSNLFAAHMENASETSSENDTRIEGEEMGETRIMQEDVEAY